jgi:histidinol-phosphate/aromatic aminotransferase/cobyric acid decarboxylase-like protein
MLVQEYGDGSGTGRRFAQDPGQIDKLWVVYGNDGVVIIDAAYYEGTPQSVIDELDAIVASVRLMQ